MERLADALGCNPAALIGAYAEPVPPTHGPGFASNDDKAQASYTHGQTHTGGFPFSAGPKDLPVLGVAIEGEDAWFNNNGQTSEYIYRPPLLSGVTDAYAVYVIGDSMSPALREGHLVHVQPIGTQSQVVKL